MCWFFLFFCCCSKCVAFAIYLDACLCAYNNFSSSLFLLPHSQHVIPSSLITKPLLVFNSIHSFHIFFSWLFLHFSCTCYSFYCFLLFTNFFFLFPSSPFCILPPFLSKSLLVCRDILRNVLQCAFDKCI